MKTINNEQITDIVTRSEGETNDEVSEGIFIENAGLVLLHPFLPRFFELLQISKDDLILLPDKAVSLLHYLATGETVSPEYELVLPKLLCGIPLATPVSATAGVSETELEESRALLEAVIGHWNAIGNTGPDGLRGNFLVRQGKLTQLEEGDWLLQVETFAYDLLLDQLPWGISRIKLPWMKKMLRVEWRM